MTLVDTDKFLSYLIYSKHIDELTCGEVKEAIEMCKVNVLDASVEDEDCISREAAISAAKHIFKSNSEMKAFCMMKILEELPPAKPKESSGEWHKSTDGYSYWYECSACGCKVPKNEWGNDYFSPFCPECGARMVESEDKA